VPKDDHQSVSEVLDLFAVAARDCISKRGEESVTELVGDVVTDARLTRSRVDEIAEQDRDSGCATGRPESVGHANIVARRGWCRVAGSVAQ
jgi:hypothetical protein